jgi:Fe(II)/alpha-ketoglutarate-dependent arginine beta-hydroxylase
MHALRTAEYILSASEKELLRLNGRQLLEETGAAPIDPDFYDKNGDCRDLLPAGLREFLGEFRDDPGSTVCQVDGFPIDDVAVGPTPAHWERPQGLERTAESDVFLAMCGSVLGDPFAWATLQYGRMIQDIFPIRGDERNESGHGSDAFLMFHTDDAFRSDSANYLLLFGVRNHDLVPTYAAAVRDVLLSDGDRTLLTEPRFHIVPDDEHIRQLERRAPGEPALLRAIEMRDRPEPVPVIYGEPDHPRIRLDAPFMRCIDDEPNAMRALATLQAELERVRRPYVAAPGTLLILDNHGVVHARESFKARYDGTDRWLRKLIVSHDLSGAGLTARTGGRVLF